MFRFSCMAQNAAEGYEAFRFAQTWAGKFHGLVTFVDEAMDTTHTWVEFEKTEVYFAHFRIGEKCLGSESLIEILVDLGVDQAVAEDAVRESRKYLSVMRVRARVVDSETGLQVERELLRVSSKPMQDDPLKRHRTA